MDKKLQQCNGCGALNTTGNKNWWRYFGAFAGAPTINMSAGINRVTGKLSALPTGETAAAQIDICESCDAKLTTTHIKELTANPNLHPFAAATSAAASTPTAAKA